MWQQQDVVHRLVDIIQKLQSQYETGQLTARHGNGSTMEEGFIIFARGKITEARLGRRSGAEALNKLSNWESCTCWFVRSINSSSGSSPYTLSNEAAEKFTNQQAYTPLPPSAHVSWPQTDPLGEPVGANRPTIPSTPGIPYPVSQPPLALQKIEQLGLSRSHRRLFLLIDGHRSIPDLARLIGRNKEDVYMLLQDLVRGEVVRISDKPPLYNI